MAAGVAGMISTLSGMHASAGENIQSLLSSDLHANPMLTERISSQVELYIE
jgi:hypothetical protein